MSLNWSLSAVFWHVDRSCLVRIWPQMRPSQWVMMFISPWPNFLHYKSTDLCLQLIQLWQRYFEIIEILWYLTYTFHHSFIYNFGIHWWLVLATVTTWCLPAADFLFPSSFCIFYWNSIITKSYLFSPNYLFTQVFIFISISSWNIFPLGVVIHCLPCSHRPQFGHRDAFVHTLIRLPSELPKNATSAGEGQVISLNEESLMAKTKLTTSIMTKI